jgi:hypothetical protein
MSFDIYTNLLILLAMRSIPRNSYAQVASWNAANHTKVLPRETRRISHYDLLGRAHPAAFLLVMLLHCQVLTIQGYKVQHG